LRLKSAFKVFASANFSGLKYKTPPKASDPYKSEAGPLITSTLSTPASFNPNRARHQIVDSPYEPLVNRPKHDYHSNHELLVFLWRFLLKLAKLLEL
jgi:hypothetical protein